MLENVPYLCGMTDKDALPQVFWHEK